MFFVFRTLITCVAFMLPGAFVLAEGMPAQVLPAGVDMASLVVLGIAMLVVLRRRRA